jgi:hypothetical protein
VLGGLCLLLPLAGCTATLAGGVTRAGGYDCTGPTNRYGCYTGAAIHLTNSGPAGTVDGVGTDLLVAPLTCDQYCENSTHTRCCGFIGTFIQLYDATDGSAIRAGYQTFWPGDAQYFYAWSYGGSGAAAGLVGATHVTSASAGSPTFVHISIYESVGEGWFIAICPGQTGQTCSNPQARVPLENFHPDSLHLMQEVYGSSGATAEGAVFSNNQILSSTSGWRPLQTDGVVTRVVTATNPSDAAWLTLPSHSSTGGTFYVSCCQGANFG